MRRTTRRYRGYTTYESRLLELERISGLTQEQISRAVFGNGSAISDIHKLKTFDPTLREVARITQYFGKPVTHLMPTYSSEGKEPTYTVDTIIERLHARIEREMLTIRDVTKRVKKVGQTAISVERIEHLLTEGDLMDERISVIYDLSKAFKVPTVLLIPIEVYNEKPQPKSDTPSIAQGIVADIVKDVVKDTPAEPSPLQGFIPVPKTPRGMKRQKAGLALSIKSSRFIFNTAFIEQYGFKPHQSFGLQYDTSTNRILIDFQGDDFHVENTGRFMSSQGLKDMIIETMQYTSDTAILFEVNPTHSNERYVILEVVSDT